MSTGKTSVHLSRNPQGRKFGGITPEIFFRLAASQSPSKIWRAAAAGKKCDASTYQSNNFGVSRKRFKPSTPGSTSVRSLKGGKSGGQKPQRLRQDKTVVTSNFSAKASEMWVSCPWVFHVVVWWRFCYESDYNRPTPPLYVWQTDSGGI